MSYSSPQLVIPLFAIVTADATRFTYANKVRDGTPGPRAHEGGPVSVAAPRAGELPYMTATAVRLPDHPSEA